MIIKRGILKGLPVVPHQAYNDWITLSVDPEWEPQTKAEKAFANQGRSVLNAAVYPPSALAEITVDDWKQILKISNDTLGKEFVYHPETKSCTRIPATPRRNK